MADIRAAQSGDFSATTTWVGGVVPGSGDVAYANTFTVTISDIRTVQAISNASGTGITVGGTFSLLNGCNLTCTNANGVVQGATTTACVTTPSLTLGNAATINANITNGPSNSSSNITLSAAGTLTLNGNLSASNGNIYCVTQPNGTLNVTGSLNGFSGSSNQGGCISITGSSSTNITGNLSSAYGAGVNCISIGNNGAVVIINGSVTGNNNVTTAAVTISAGSLTINGPVQSGTVAPAVQSSVTTTQIRLSGPLLLSSNNLHPVLAPSWRWAPTQIPTYYEVPTSGGTTKRNLYTADNIPTANYPTQGNVRSGTVYGPNLENTGTLAVPAPGSVALGVATDNTTGTAVLTSAAVQTALGAFSSGRLNNVATVDTTGAQIQAAVNT
jgi:hypothetical protein